MLHSDFRSVAGLTDDRSPERSSVIASLRSAPCAHLQGVRLAINAGNLAEAATYVRRFREIDAGALADSNEMVEMDAAVEG